MLSRKKLLINTFATSVALFSATNDINAVEEATAHEEPYYVVDSGDNLYRIALNHGVELDELKSLNGLQGDLIHPGDRLIIPQEEDTEPTEEKEEKNNQVYGTYLRSDQYETLLEVVQQESGGQDYDSVLAVMSVITNRVDTDWYPDTIWEVVTQPGQFEAYGAGHYTRHRGKVTDTTKQAVHDALHGKKNVDVLNFWSDWYYIEQGRNDSEAVNIGGNIFFNL